MSISRRAASRLARSAPRSRRFRLVAGLGALLLVGCDTGVPSPTPDAASASAAAAVSRSPAPTPAPTPTPEPTPRFSNAPDPELAALIPEVAAGVAVNVPPITELSLAPGDIGEVYGDIGVRFVSLVAGYVNQPRATLYAMRVEGDPVTTDDLEPYLEEIGRYVGIAGLVREPWQLGSAGGHQVWMRPEDNATAAGTMIYTWAADEYVFLLIGVDPAVNGAILSALPGEPPPTPRPSPTTRATPSAVPTESDAGG